MSSSHPFFSLGEYWFWGSYPTLFIFLTKIQSFLKHNNMTTGSELQAILVIMDRRLSQLEQRLTDVESELSSNSVSKRKNAAPRKGEVKVVTPQPKPQARRVKLIYDEPERNFKYSKQTLLKFRKEFFARKGILVDPFEIKSKIVVLPTNNVPTSPTSIRSSATKVPVCDVASDNTSTCVGESDKSSESVEPVKKIAHNLIIEEDDDEQQNV